jgi:hypothetical protein
MNTIHTSRPARRAMMLSIATGAALLAGCGASHKVTAPAAATPPKPGVAAQVAPADGRVLRVIPRVTTLSWQPAAGDDPAGLTYTVEIEREVLGTFQPFQKVTGLAATSLKIDAFPEDANGRWRVTTIGPGGAGAPSEFRAFSFNTSAGQYVGTWVPDVRGPISRINISAKGQLIGVQVTTSTGAVQSGTKAASGEPVIVPLADQLGTISQSIALTLSEDGQQLGVRNPLDIRAFTTLTFHRVVLL